MTNMNHTGVCTYPTPQVTQGQLWSGVYIYPTPLPSVGKVSFETEYISTQPLCYWSEMTQGQFWGRVYIYPSPLPLVGDDTRSVLRQSIYLPKPSAIGRRWHKVSFEAEYIFTQALCHWSEMTQGQFWGRVYSYPTPLPLVGDNTRSVLRQSIYLTNHSSIGRRWLKVSFEDKRWFEFRFFLFPRLVT